MRLRSRARTISSVQPALVGAVTLTVQVQILFCCFEGAGEKEGESVSPATIAHLIPAEELKKSIQILLFPTETEIGD